MNSNYKCNVCDIMCTGPMNFQQHENSEKHKKKVARYQDLATNPTPEGPLADNNLQPIRCSTCNVLLVGLQSFQAHVNSLKHADMVRKISSGSNAMEDPLECTLEKPEIAKVNTVNNPGSSIPFEGYKVSLGSFEYCVICKMQFSGPEQHQQHLTGKPHQKKLKLFGLNAQINQTESGSSIPVIAVAKNDIPNNSTSLYVQCEVCQARFSGPVPYQQHLASDLHKKKIIQKELMTVKLSFDTVDSDKIMPFIKPQEEAASIGTTLVSHEKGSCSDGSVNNKPFAVCTPCNMQFTGPELYQLHVESVGHQRQIGIQRNSVNPVFKCDICNVIFSGPIPYNDHLDSPKHKKKVQNVKFLNQFEKNKSLGQDSLVDKINGMPSGVNSEYYCEVCKINTTGPESYRQHIYGEPHKKKARAANAFCNVDNTNQLQNGLSDSESNNSNHNLKRNNFYISRDLILCDGIGNMGDVPHDNLNVHIFYPDDEIVFDKPIKKNNVV